MRMIISLAYCSIAALSISLAISAAASSETSEIGLYPPDLRAIRRMSSPTGALSLPSGADSSRVADAWDRVSKKGREFLLREPGLALVVVDSSGKWLYRSTGITSLRPVYNPGDGLRRKDAEDLDVVLNNHWCRKLRDFYERVLFSTGPYATGATRGTASPVAMAYGSFLAEVESGSGRNEDNAWFRRIVGYEIRGLDENTRAVLVRDLTYGAEIAKATAAAEEIRRLQLNAVLRPSSNVATPQVNIDDIAFMMPPQPGDPATMGTVDVITVDGEKIISWSLSAGVVFIKATKDTANVPSEFSRERLRALLKDDKVKAFVSSPATTNILQLKASRLVTKQ